MIDLTQIKFLVPNDKVTEFVKGWSEDKTFVVERDDKRYFLKILTKNSDKCNFENFDIYTKLKIDIPKPLEYGILNSNMKYYITEYINAKDFGDVLPNLSDEFIFSSAQNLGKEQRSIANTFGIKVSHKAR